MSILVADDSIIKKKSALIELVFWRIRRMEANTKAPKMSPNGKRHC